MKAERETVDRLIAHFLADRIGATFDGHISGVTRAGLFVKLDETGADGFVPAAHHRQRIFPLSRGAPRADRRSQRRDPPARRQGDGAAGRGGAGGRRAALRTAVGGRPARTAAAAAEQQARKRPRARKPSREARARQEATPMNEVTADRIERMNRFVKRMNAVERDLTSPYMRPRDAATLILVDRSGPAPKVLLASATRHKFMPGKFVFPGGRVEPDDGRMPAARPSIRRPRRSCCSASQRAERRGARACARGDPRDLRGDRPAARRASRRPQGPGRPLAAFAQAGILPTSARCISSPAPSRRRAVRAASTRASSPPTPRRSPTASTACRARRRIGRTGLGADREASSSTCRP